jgi:hypothetical protein
MIYFYIFVYVLIVISTYIIMSIFDHIYFKSSFRDTPQGLFFLSFIFPLGLVVCLAIIISEYFNKFTVPFLFLYNKIGKWLGKE